MPRCLETSWCRTIGAGGASRIGTMGVVVSVVWVRVDPNADVATSAPLTQLRFWVGHAKMRLQRYPHFDISSLLRQYMPSSCHKEENYQTLS
ncbi:hypothetical protein SLA2020_264970 [Shorea laevis]